MYILNYNFISGDKSSAFTYNDSDDLTSVKDAKNNLYQYTYNSAHQVTQAVAPVGQKVEFDYYSNGNFRYSAISNSGGTMKIRTGKTYTAAENGIAAGAYVAQEKDEDGRATVYDYDKASGRLKSVTTPDGTVTSYTYQSGTDLLTQVTSGGTTVDYAYDTDSNTRLETITHNGFNYTFGYDSYGNLVSVKAGNTTLSTNAYRANNGKLSASTYGNGDVLSYGYDTAGNVSSVSLNGTARYEWVYDAAQLLSWYKDIESSRKTSYEYDVTGRIIGVRASSTAYSSASNCFIHESRYEYDSLDNLSKEWNITSSAVYETAYSYNKNSQPSSVAVGNKNLTYDYDTLGRLSSKTVDTTTNLKYNYLYQYSERAGTTEYPNMYRTSRIGRELIGDKTYRYIYDTMGNITTVFEGERVPGTETDIQNEVTNITYQYDSRNQLIRENNAERGVTITYSYDSGGNLLSKSEYAYTTAAAVSGTPTKTYAYTYDSAWKDKLVSYGGSVITYDEIGNPTSYLGKTMTWEGRDLKSLTSGSTTVQYRYGADGLSTYKNVNGTVHEYFYSNGRLAYESFANHKLYYIYDGYGILCAVYHNNGSTAIRYHVATTVRGDVEALYNDAGALVAKYEYDSWGKILGVYDGNGDVIENQWHIANLNPIRYRGYYYDAETGFYYLGSRYYDPEVGRFINTDTTDVLTVDIASIYQKNLYVYCGNNPVNYLDAEGYIVIPAIVAKVGWTVLDITVSVGISWISAKITGEEFSKDDMIKTAIIAGIGSFGLVSDMVISLWSGLDTLSSTYNAGYSIETAIMAGGASAVGTYCGLNSLVGRNIDELGNMTQAVFSATVGLGDSLITTVAVKSTKINGTSRKIASRNAPKKVPIARTEGRNYLKVSNGKLMR